MAVVGLVTAVSGSHGGQLERRERVRDLGKNRNGAPQIRGTRGCCIQRTGSSVQIEVTGPCFNRPRLDPCHIRAWVTPSDHQSATSGSCEAVDRVCLAHATINGCSAESPSFSIQASAPRQYSLTSTVSPSEQGRSAHGSSLLAASRDHCMWRYSIQLREHYCLLSCAVP